MYIIQYKPYPFCSWKRCTIRSQELPVYLPFCSRPHWRFNDWLTASHFEQRASKKWRIQLQQVTRQGCAQRLLAVGSAPQDRPQRLQRQGTRGNRKASTLYLAVTEDRGAPRENGGDEIKTSIKSHNQKENSSIWRLQKLEDLERVREGQSHSQKLLLSGSNWRA